jgi:cysteine desulfurase / selenocysteine lyase
MMRPLRALEQRGVEITVVQCSDEGALDTADVAKAIRPNTVLVALTHASNIAGTILPIAAVGALARERNLLFLVDAAQTAGALPLDMEACNIDLLAFTGHKSLYGPMGTGGLIFGTRVNPQSIVPLAFGGTGSRSEHEIQPDFLPDRFESGTPNVIGLAGLAAGCTWVLQTGVETIRRRECQLTKRLIGGLQAIDGVRVLGTFDADRQTATVSFTVDNVTCSTMGMRLDDEHGILCRTGLHCSPAGHKTFGTFPEGTVRFSLGYSNTAGEVDTAVAAVRTIASGAPR